MYVPAGPPIYAWSLLRTYFSACGRDVFKSRSPGFTDHCCDARPHRFHGQGPKYGMYTYIYIYICIYIGIFSIYHCYTGKVEAVPLSMASLALGILGLNLPLHGLVLILLLLSVLIVGPSCPLPRGPPPIVRAPAFVPRVAPSLGLSLLPGLLLLEGFQQCTLASPRSTLDRTLYVEASLAEFYTYEACKVYRYVFMYMYSI